MSVSDKTHERTLREVKRLQAENERLRAENARLRSWTKRAAGQMESAYLAFVHDVEPALRSALEETP